MASRSWNRIELIGNLTRDPELRYTPNGAAVCSFGIATNRSYVIEGERREEVDFHRLVAWNKLGELCNQLLKKGNKVFVSGRLQYREWETPEGQKRKDAEIVLEDMVLLTSKGAGDDNGDFAPQSAPATDPDVSIEEPAPSKSSPAKADKPSADEIVSDDDLPF
jgi:single-strand DNA-binding protein